MYLTQQTYLSDINKGYEKGFNLEIERILNKIYYQLINNDGKDKRAAIDWDYKYTQYLLDNELIRYISSHSPTGVMLKTKGYEVFENIIVGRIIGRK